MKTLIHILPKFLAPFEFYEFIRLIDVTIPEFNLKLEMGKELALRKPYPNKHYLVACLSTPRKAQEGFLLSLPECPDSYSVITRWRLADATTISHVVRHKVTDPGHDAISDDYTLWYGHPSGSFKDRFYLSLNEEGKVSSKIEEMDVPTIPSERLASRHNGNPRFPDPANAVHCEYRSNPFAVAPELNPFPSDGTIWNFTPVFGEASDANK